MLALAINTSETLVVALLVVALFFLIQYLKGILAPNPAVSIGFYVVVDDSDGNPIKKEIDMLVLKAGESRKLGLVFKDAFGNLTTADGKPNWSATGDAGIVVDETGLTATVSSTGTVTVGQIAVEADGDLTENVKSIFGNLDYKVIPGDATVVEIAVLPTEPAPTPTPV